MSEHSRIDTILEELTRLDPSFSTREADLRVILSELIEKRPEVVLDQAFRTSLRARLMLKERSIRSPYASLSTWALRLAPIGALALLLLVLAPESTFRSGSGINSVTPSEPDSVRENILRIETGGGHSSPVGVYGMGGDTSIDSTATMKTMSVPATPQTPSPIHIPPQTEGTRITVASVATQRPAFIVLRTYLPDGSDEVIGTSPLLYSGTTENVPVYLRTATKAGAFYTAVLYNDNGDTVFNAMEDQAATDRFGNVVSVTVEIVSGN